MDLVCRLDATGFISLFLLYHAAAWTQTPAQNQTTIDAFEGTPVAQIRFDPAIQPVEQSVINSLMALHAGQPFRVADARQAIENLYGTGRYEDIQIDAEPSQSGVDLRFITKQSWFFGHVEIRGDVSEPPNLGQILSVAGLTLGQPFDSNEVTAGEGRIKKLLTDNGYFNPSVDHELQYDNAYQQVHIIYNVKVGKRAHYAPPAITGDTSAVTVKQLDKATDWQRFLMPGYRSITQTRTRVGIDKIRLTYQNSNRLFATVTFSGITQDPVEGKHTPTGTAHVAVTPGPLVEVKATGAKVSQKTLRDYLPIYEEGAVDADLLAEGETNLRDYFQGEGYFDVAVDFKQQQVSNGKTDIEYAIQTGPRHRLVALIIRGNKYFDEKTIRERMSIVPKSFEFRRGRYSEAMAARDKAVIEDLYRSNGFRDVRIVAESQDDYKNVKNDIAASFSIEEGSQYFVEKLAVTGVKQLDLSKTLDRLSSQEGQPFSEFDVASDRQSILDRYGAAGFADATFEWTWGPGTKPNTVDLQFVINEGTPQFVREVVVTGLSATRRQLVQGQLTEHTDDPLSASSMADTQRKLYDLGIFSQVNMAVQDPDGDEDRRTVLFDLQEASRYSVTAGLGTEFGRIGGGTPAEDLSNPGGSTTLTPRVSLSLSRLNLFGRGQSVGLQIRLSTVQKRASVNYFVPRVFSNPKLEGNFTVLYEDTFDVNTFRDIRREVTAQISQHFSKTLTSFYRASYRDVGVSDLKISPLLVPRLAQSVRVGILSYNLVHDRRDDPTDPTKGIYSTIDLAFASRALGSQTSFGRVLGRNATYYRLGPKFVLARETQFGLEPAFDLHGSTSPGDPDPIPLPERFYGGGGNTMRGYPQNQAGPRDGETGFPLGGSALFFNNTEVRFPLYGANLRGVLFEDMGNVFSTPSAISFRFNQKNISDFNYMSHAVGFGIRYRTPLGPLRLDVAYSLNPPKYNGFSGDYTQLVQCSASGTCLPSTQHVSHFQFFFSIGQAF